MYRLALISFVIVAVACQKEGGKRVPKYAGDPQIAAILQEQRYLSGDGTFGAAYQQEDGIDFKEESDAEGNRRGSYSYVDPNGQRRTITYTAGKNGFQASGDHLPVAPAGPVAPAPVAPQAQYNPGPQAQYNPAPAPAPAARNYNPNEDDGQYHPELYEQENYVAPAPRTYSPAPVQPQPQFQAQNIYPGVQQAQYSGVQQQNYVDPAQPAARQYYDATTPPPHRFFPPGKFSLNRSPDGYSYTFSKA